MSDESPELRELKRQTRMMAEKEATRAATGGLFLGIVADIVIASNRPEMVPWPWVYWALPIGLAVLAYIGTMKRHTDG